MFHSQCGKETLLAALFAFHLFHFARRSTILTRGPQVLNSLVRCKARLWGAGKSTNACTEKNQACDAEDLGSSLFRGQSRPVRGRIHKKCPPAGWIENPGIANEREGDRKT